jgi:hypothetical protein
MRGRIVGQLQDVLIRLDLMKDTVANRDEFYGPGTPTSWSSGSSPARG